MDYSIVNLALDHLFAGVIDFCQLGSECALRLSGLGLLPPFMPATVLTSTVSGPYLIKSPESIEYAGKVSRNHITKPYLR
jgi:hypothetical protein